MTSETRQECHSSMVSFIICSCSSLCLAVCGLPPRPWMVLPNGAQLPPTPRTPPPPPRGQPDTVRNGNYEVKKENVNVGAHILCEALCELAICS